MKGTSKLPNRIIVTSNGTNQLDFDTTWLTIENNRIKMDTGCYWFWNFNLNTVEKKPLSRYYTYNNNGSTIVDWRYQPTNYYHLFRKDTITTSVNNNIDWIKYKSYNETGASYGYALASDFEYSHFNNPLGHLNIK